MKHTFLLLTIFLTMSFTSCKDGDSKKDKTENNTEEEVNLVAGDSIVASEDASTDGEGQKLPVMTFEETEYDFGTISGGTEVVKIFKFTNTGEAPLVITDASSSCGCTVPSKPEEPIAPGETGKIEVKYNGSGTGQVTKVVTISANTQEGRETLKIKGIVESSKTDK